MTQDGGADLTGLAPGATVSLTVVRGPDSGMKLEFVGPKATIGRKRGDLLVSDREASGLHASIERAADGTFVLRDLGSTNGTYLDGRRITLATIRSGQQLKCGANYLLFTVSSEEDGGDTRHLEIRAHPSLDEDPLGLLGSDFGGPADPPGATSVTRPVAATPAPSRAGARAGGPEGASASPPLTERPAPAPIESPRSGVSPTPDADLEELEVPPQALAGLPGLPSLQPASVAQTERTAPVPTGRTPSPPPGPVRRPFGGGAGPVAPTVAARTEATMGGPSAGLPPLPPSVPSAPAAVPMAPPAVVLPPIVAPTPAGAPPASVETNLPVSAAREASPPPPLSARPFGASGPMPARAGHAAGSAAADEPLPEGVEPSVYGIYLVVERGRDAGLVVPLSRETTVLGRSETDIVVNDADVSRRHAAIDILGEGKYVLRDLASTNGTLLNGIRVRSEPIANNDKIRVGGTTIKFIVGTGRIAAEVRRILGA